MKITLDTDVVVAAMRSPRGASAELLRAVRAGRVTLHVSVPLAVEYEATCQKKEHAPASGLDESDVSVFVDAVIAIAWPVETHYLWRPQLHDPGDEMVLEAAVNGGANALVTFNKRHFRDAPSRFGIELLLPREALARIG